MCRLGSGERRRRMVIVVFVQANDKERVVDGLKGLTVRDCASRRAGAHGKVALCEQAGTRLGLR